MKEKINKVEELIKEFKNIIKYFNGESQNRKYY